MAIELYLLKNLQKRLILALLKFNFFLFGYPTFAMATNLAIFRNCFSNYSY
jgi:hypothetical protein